MVVGWYSGIIFSTFLGHILGSVMYARTCSITLRGDADTLATYYNKMIGLSDANTNTGEWC